MSGGSKHLLLKRDFVSHAPPFCARSPSIARRQYGHVVPGEKVGHSPGGRLCLSLVRCQISFFIFTKGRDKDTLGHVLFQAIENLS